MTFFQKTQKQIAKRDYMQKMRIDISFRVRQFLAPNGFSEPSFGRFTEIDFSMLILVFLVDVVFRWFI